LVLVRKYFLFLLLLFPAEALRAQRMHFANVSNAIGLPSMESYNVTQDKRGYIWIGTNAGLCRYNGSSLKIYNKNEGLPEAAVYFIKENRQGKLEAITSGHRILEIVEDSIRESPYNAAYIKKINNRLEITYDLNRDAKGNLVINAQGFTVHMDRDTKAISPQKTGDTAYGANSNFVVDSRGEESFLVRNDYIKMRRDGSGKFSIAVQLLSKAGSKILKFFFNEGYGIDYRLKVCRQGGYTFFNIHNQLVRFDEALNYTVYNLPSPILALYPDMLGGLWLGTFQNGLYYYSDVHSMRLTAVGLDGFTVSGVAMDREEGIWCSTIEKGVFYCNDRRLIYYSNIPELKKSAEFLKQASGRIFLSTVFGQFFVLGKDTVFKKEVLTASNGVTTDVMRLGDNWYFAGKGGMVVMNKDFEQVRLLRMGNFTGYFYSYRLDTFNGKIYGVGKNFCFEVKDNIAHMIYNGSHTLKSLLILNDRFWLLGTADGLYELDLRTSGFRQFKGLNSGVTSILRRADGSLLVATKGEGLFTLRKGQLVRERLNTEIQPTLVFDIVEDRYGTLWLASNNGLIKVSPKTEGEKVGIYSAANMLPANEVNEIACDSTFIYLSTAEGICRISLMHSLVNTTPPVIYSNTMTVNGRVLAPGSSMIFSHRDNSLVFGFDVLAFKREGKNLLRYQLLGTDMTWKSSRQNELHFDNLLPGSYELTVYALNSSGIKSNLPVRFKLVIRKPLWQTVWFLSACLLVFFLLVFIVVRAIIRNVRHKEEEKTRINKLIAGSRLMALQARMNPHFIFNAINSIQNYILKQQEEKAYNYLTKFSKLIRKVLNNSGKNAISLHEELETLELYVELEQLRFKNSFDFVCEVSGDLDEYEVSIPVMFIQPYMENAIGHGLINLDKEHRGVLTLKIAMENRLLKIVIEDNGVGRKRAGEYKKANLHRPVAMSLTEQRLEIIRKMENFEGVRVLVTDLYDPSGFASGTRVELFLPLTI
jgi:ligand-binding sensor domain-containing protein